MPKTRWDNDDMLLDAEQGWPNDDGDDGFGDEIDEDAEYVAQTEQSYEDASDEVNDIDPESDEEFIDDEEEEF